MYLSRDKKILENVKKVLKNSDFREAHEILEDAWRLEDRKSLRGRILKGLTNGATSLELRRLGRVDGSKRVWQTFQKFDKLENHSPQLKEISQLIKEKSRYVKI
ncbi:protein of unknown function (DUF309) [Thiovulum sp. ES]|nr:protein of unknown function (DUF309) [Thiovulum sp. ES]